MTVSPEPRPWLIVGAGAIGTAFAGFLARTGRPLVLYGRGPHWQTIRRDGLHLEGIWGDYPAVSIPTLGETEAWAGPAPEAVFIAVKSFDTDSAAAVAGRFAGRDTLIVSLQNGLGNCEILEVRFGRERVVGGRVIFGSLAPAPGTTRITVCAAPVMLGPWPAGAPSARMDALAREIARAGIPCQSTDRIQAYLWAKVLYNCALNPLSALLRCTYGDLAGHRETRELMRRIVEEVYAVAAAAGVAMLYPDAESYWRHFLENEVPPTRAHRSSMWQAVEAGKRTEIDAMSGEIARQAQRYHVPAPVNAMLTDLVHVLERAR